MKEPQALVAIWINVAQESRAEFRQWHNCEHSTDRLEGPGFRVCYRYNAIDESDHHDILCTFEGDGLAAFESDYYKDSRNNPSPWTRKCMAFITGAERAVFGLEAALGGRPRYDAPYVYAVSLNPVGGSDAEAEIIAWYREEHLPRLCALRGVERGRVFRHSEETTGGPTEEAKIQETNVSRRTLLALYDVTDPGVPGSPAWAEAAYGTQRSEGMKPMFSDLRRELWWLDFVKWKTH